jgi:hypothetical protein
MRAWKTPRSDVAAAYEDVDAARALSPEARVAEAAALSRSALALMGRFSDRERRRLVFEQEPLDPAREAAWLALVGRSRAR